MLLYQSTPDSVAYLMQIYYLAVLLITSLTELLEALGKTHFLAFFPLLEAALAPWLMILIFKDTRVASLTLLSSSCLSLQVKARKGAAASPATPRNRIVRVGSPGPSRTIYLHLQSLQPSSHLQSPFFYVSNHIHRLRASGLDLFGNCYSVCRRL